MQEYKVKSLYLGGKGKKIYRSGDVITQANVNAPVEELEKNGFLVAIASGEPAASVESDDQFKDLSTLAPEVEPEKAPVLDAPVEEPVKEVPEVEAPVEEVVSEEVNPLLAESVGLPAAGEVKEFPGIEEFSYEEIINSLKSLEVTFKHNISKKEAYGLLKAQKQG